MSNLIKTIYVQADQQKGLSNDRGYDKIEIYDNKVVGSGKSNTIWFFKDYIGIHFVKASLLNNSSFAQVMFLTNLNTTNIYATADNTRILFNCGMYSFKATNSFAETIANDIKDAFDNYQKNAEELEKYNGGATLSAADEIKKFKDLLDSGVISQEEFDAKKKQLLGL